MPAVLNQCLNTVNEVYNQVVTANSAVGARQQALSTLQTTLGNLQQSNKSQTSALQDADVTQLTIELTQVQNYYQATLASASKILNLSLSDYLTDTSTST